MDCSDGNEISYSVPEQAPTSSKELGIKYDKASLQDQIRLTFGTSGSILPFFPRDSVSRFEDDVFRELLELIKSVRSDGAVTNLTDRRTGWTFGEIWRTFFKIKIDFEKFVPN